MDVANTRAVPGTDLSGDPGHEAGRRPMHVLKGGCAEPNIQQPTMGTNTGAPHPGPVATDAESPTSGFMGGSMQAYTGGAA